MLPDYDLEAICRGVGVTTLRLERDADIARVIEEASAVTATGAPVVVDVAIDYSRKTFFTRGVVMTILGRLPWPDRLRFVARAVGRKLMPAE